MNRILAATLATFLAAITTSFAATVITAGSGWQSFNTPITVSPVGQFAPDGPFTITSSSPIRIDITDYRNTGESYSIFNGTDSSGSLLLRTPTVALDSAPVNFDLDQTFADSRFSHGQFFLPAGTHTFVVRQESALPGYYTEWNLGIRANVVPEPATSILLAGASLIFCTARTRKTRA